MDTKDGVTSDSEDGSLTPEQAELPSRREGLLSVACDPHSITPPP